ncbi:hypothetical protein [Pedobacter jamesrossensis]|uniref:DUF4440 domain-containing protein n=1 Tax=Pedobacter jamesrossensis TaxID=1908238 RepID=A0ABV8NSN3_9SPHI
METDLIIKEIDAIHKKADFAFENKNISDYIIQFDDSITYKNAEALTFDKKELINQTEKYFRKTKSISTTYYRIKSSIENEVFTEKIARKSIIYLKGILFSKKQTIQTEEVLKWKNINGEWKVVGFEITLEEKY